MSNSQRYIAIVNGITVGSFETVNEAHNAGCLAVAAGIVPYKMNGPARILEIRDSQSGYVVVNTHNFG